MVVWVSYEEAGKWERRDEGGGGLEWRMNEWNATHSSEGLGFVLWLLGRMRDGWGLGWVGLSYVWCQTWRRCILEPSPAFPFHSWPFDTQFTAPISCPNPSAICLLNLSHIFLLIIIQYILLTGLTIDWVWFYILIIWFVGFDLKIKFDLIGSNLFQSQLYWFFIF